MRRSAIFAILENALMITLFRRLLVALCLGSAVVVNCACSANPFKPTTTLQPTETVVLPKRIDPNQQPLRLRHGTAVYVVIPAQFEWTTTENGIRVLHIDKVFSLKSITKADGKTIAVSTTGERKVFPSSAVRTGAQSVTWGLSHRVTRYQIFYEDMSQTTSCRSAAP
jgi:hypothetical protein